MCTPTNELRFCTCKLGNKLPVNYWKLYRYNSKKKMEIMGELSYIFNDPVTKWSIANIILISLNNSGCFDKDLIFKNRDVLEVNVNYRKTTYEYYFKLLKGVWKPDEKMNCFDVISDYDKVNEGKTKPTIAKLLKNIL